MNTTPTSFSSTPALTDETTLKAAVECLSKHLPITMEGNYRPQDLFTVFLHAASRGDSLEHTTQSLAGVPTGNAIRYPLDKLNDMATLEHQLNTALQSRIPPQIAKGRHRMAMDLHCHHQSVTVFR